ncbi:MAG: Rid family hydrolase, partial [Paenibacillus macerans]|nr:Rid family hydrolase [Paenibacillus macerans]
MDKQAISTTSAPGAIGPYSQGVGLGDLVFTSGQLGLVPETGQFAEGVQAQT